jgi:hypothetical protein
MVWKKCEITGAPEESCAHCNPDRYLPPIKTRGRWQIVLTRRPRSAWIPSPNLASASG